MNDTKKKTNLEITQVINQPYKYGFETQVEKEDFPVGMNEEILKLLSEKKKEPPFLFDFRLKAYKKWKEMKFPTWANLTIGSIAYDQMKYYSIPKQKIIVSV